MFVFVNCYHITFSVVWLDTVSWKACGTPNNSETYVAQDLLVLGLLDGCEQGIPALEVVLHELASAREGEPVAGSRFDTQ